MKPKKSHFVGEEASLQFKQQRLLEDYLEVQKEFVSKKKKLQIAKQKRDVLLAEVKFLRRRQQHLKIQSEDLEAKQGVIAPEIFSAQSRMLANNENHGVDGVSPSNLPSVRVAQPILGDENQDRERKEEVVLELPRADKKRKNHGVAGKRVGKKKISWQDHVALKAFSYTVKLDR